MCPRRKRAENHDAVLHGALSFIGKLHGAREAGWCTQHSRGDTEKCETDSWTTQFQENHSHHIAGSYLKADPFHPSSSFLPQCCPVFSCTPFPQILLSSDSWCTPWLKKARLASDKCQFSARLLPQGHGGSPLHMQFYLQMPPLLKSLAH